MSSRLVIRGATRTYESESPRCDLAVQDGRIIEVGGDIAAEPSDVVVDGDGCLLAPGLVDLQVNGFGGVDLAMEPHRLAEVATALTRLGVTAFLPTLVSSKPHVIERALGASLDVPQAAAAPLGWHLEGPMLAPTRAGAHERRHLRSASPTTIDGWTTAAGVVAVTVAPELPGALDVIAELRRRGIAVFAGHTEATSEEFLLGVDAGVRAITHLFNAMPPLLHRHPGPIGAGLNDPRVLCCLIADGHHVDPLVVAVAAASLLPHRMVLVSDAVAAAGLPAGHHTLGVQPVISDGHTVRLQDGTLAGSLLTLDVAVRNLVTFTGCPLATAAAAASLNACRAIGLDGRGVLEPGAVADAILLDPQGHVMVTIVRGTVAHDPTGRAGQR